MNMRNLSVAFCNRVLVLPEERNLIGQIPINKTPIEERPQFVGPLDIAIAGLLQVELVILLW
jgi:hypothetical protein